MERRISAHLMTPAEDCIVVKPYGTSSDGESDDTRDPRCAGFNSAIVSAFEQLSR
jgi:hypothetical protein